ncbi:DUF2933 domain-containing protein [Amycolatopsis decaplanina]|uniref:DUF2933 domain-containing protein n=1 Tax=Amycolatopsis decaplanina DSM 44594 TaxID=1284240 RepID=M2ZE09_9PSEU|nr:DUF2933 domain-containing protein [Amycolatopsis decaplanina]EME58584.1 hypothetical protein H074_18433 [Amycolatopsis decaplanina DSM 44594]
MKRRHLPLYAIALAILIVGLMLTGVPAQLILFGLLVPACPLMMLLMMGGHGGPGRHTGDRGDHQSGHTDRPAS